MLSSNGQSEAEQRIGATLPRSTQVFLSRKEYSALIEHPSGRDTIWPHVIADVVVDQHSLRNSEHYMYSVVIRPCFTHVMRP